MERGEFSSAREGSAQMFGGDQWAEAWIEDRSVARWFGSTGRQAAAGGGGDRSDWAGWRKGGGAASAGGAAASGGEASDLLSWDGGVDEVQSLVNGKQFGSLATRRGGRRLGSVHA